MSSTSITLRIRTQLGVWRVHNLNTKDTLLTVRQRVQSEHKTDLKGLPFTVDIAGKTSLSDDLTISMAGLSHGDMIYAMVDESKTGLHESSQSGKKIAKDGSIVAQDYSQTSQKNGFRPGLMPLRSMKMAWTLNEFVSLNEQFEFKIKRQEQSICSKACIDRSIIQDFQQYMMNFDYRKMR